MRAHSVNFMNKVFNTDDTMFTKSLHNFTKVALLSQGSSKRTGNVQ